MPSRRYRTTESQNMRVISYTERRSSVSCLWRKIYKNIPCNSTKFLLVFWLGRTSTVVPEFSKNVSGPRNIKLSFGFEPKIVCNSLVDLFSFGSFWKLTRTHFLPAKHRVPDNKLTKGMKKIIKWNSRRFLRRCDHLICFSVIWSFDGCQIWHLPFLLRFSLLPFDNFPREFTSKFSFLLLLCHDIFKNVIIFCKSCIKKSLCYLHTLGKLQPISTLLVSIQGGHTWQLKCTDGDLS